jgi:long-chain acyl-CoA synthetase
MNEAAHILPTSYRSVSIFDGVISSAKKFPEKIAIVEDTRRLTYRQLADRAGRVASAAKELFENQDYHTAVMLPNCLEYMEVVGGLSAARLPPALVNPKSTSEELSRICNDAEARILVAHVSNEDVARAATLDTVTSLIIVGKDYDDWLQQCNVRSDALSGVKEWEAFGLHYTSGSTGKPKGALVSHRSRVLTMFGMASEYGCFGPEDRGLAISPMYTGGGFIFALAPIFFGGTLVILPSFDPEKALQLVESEAITNANVVPTHIDRMLRLGSKVVNGYRTSSLTALISGGATFPMELKERTIETFGSSILHELYGSTEGGIFTNLRPPDQMRKPSSVGMPFPCTEIRLINNAGSEIVTTEPGEFFSKSPYHFNGYRNNPLETSKRFRGNWLSVGDIATRDEEGYFSIVGRKTDMIISGGQNIYPGEIEQVINSHPCVREAVAVGVPDLEWGESVRAFVVLRDGMDTNTESLSTHCRRFLSSFKVPKSFHFIDELPRDPMMGKVARKKLTNNLST